MITRRFHVQFYVEGNDDIGYWAYKSISSPRDQFGWGKTVVEAVSNLCRLLSSGLDTSGKRGVIMLTPSQQKKLDYWLNDSDYISHFETKDGSLAIKVKNKIKIRVLDSWDKNPGNKSAAFRAYYFAENGKSYDSTPSRAALQLVETVLKKHGII